MKVAVLRTATFAIGASTALVSLLVIILGYLPEAVIAGGVIPARFEDLPQLEAVLPDLVLPAILTPLSATFLHAGVAHLLFNLLLLVWCGLAVERVIGKGPLILIYLLGAYTAAVAQMLLQSDPFVPMIGASGAVSALLGAYALGFGRPREVSSSPTINRAINALWLLAAWIAIQWGIDFATRGSGTPIATAAHVGGFLAGLFAWRPLLQWRYRRA